MEGTATFAYSRPPDLWQLNVECFHSGKIELSTPNSSPPSERPYVRLQGGRLVPFNANNLRGRISAPVGPVFDHVEAPVWPHLDVDGALPGIFRAESFQNRFSIITQLELFIVIKGCRDDPTPIPIKDEQVMVQALGQLVG